MVATSEIVLRLIDFLIECVDEDRPEFGDRVLLQTLQPRFQHLHKVLLEAQWRVKLIRSLPSLDDPKHNTKASFNNFFLLLFAPSC